jgi:ATP-dependent helicase YprA (DUF1998 family)
VENKRGRIHRVNSRNTIIAIIATLSASLAFAEDFKTINGKEYKDATVTEVEPDGIVVKTKSEFQRSISLNFLKTFRNGFIMVLRRQLERQARNASARPKAPNPPPRSSMARLPSISLRNEFQKNSRSEKRYYRGNTHPAQQRRRSYVSLLSIKPSWL